MGITRKWISSPINLQKGKNILKIGEFETQDIEVRVKSGGPIYFKNEYSQDIQSKNVKIYIEGGILFPLFRINDNEKESIKRYSQGEALFVCGNRRVRMNVMVTREELESFGDGGGL